MVAGDAARPEDAEQSWVWVAAVTSLSNVATILFLGNLCFQVREVPWGPEGARQKRGQNRDGFGIVMHSRGSTGKGICMYQAGKKVT